MQFLGVVSQLFSALGLRSMATQDAGAVAITGGSINGVAGGFTSVSSSSNITATGYIQSNRFGAQFLAPNYMHYSDSSNYYILLTGTQTPTTAYNGLRPFAINLSTGYVTMSQGLSLTGGLTVDSVNVTSSFGVGNSLQVTGSNVPTLRVFNTAAPGPSGSPAGRYVEQYVDSGGSYVLRFVNGAYSSGPAILTTTSDANSNPLALTFYGTSATFSMPVTVGALTASSLGISGGANLYSGRFNISDASGTAYASYASFFTSDGTRRGYVGWGDGAGNILLTGDNGWGVTLGGANVKVTPAMSLSSTLSVAGASTLAALSTSGLITTNSGTKGTGLVLPTSNASYTGNTLNLWNDGNAHIEAYSGSANPNTLWLNQSSNVPIATGTGTFSVGGVLSLASYLQGPGATLGTYGALSISGSKNGWGGIHFNGSATLMVNGDTTGFYNTANNNWNWYWNGGTLVTGTVPAANVGIGVLPGGMGAVVGEVKYLAMNSVPTGYLKCNGAAVSRTTYAALFAALTLAITGSTTNGSTSVTSVSSTAGLSVGMPISGSGIASGTTIASIGNGAITLSANATATGTGAALTVAPWGVGDGSTTFNVPDYRGSFLRVLDEGRGLDSASSRAIGSYQGDQVVNHVHGANSAQSSGGGATIVYTGSGGNVGLASGSNAVGTTLSITTTIYGNGGAETTPKNYATIAVIKY